MEHDYARTSFFAGGRWITASGSELIEVVNPADQVPFGHVPNCSTADVDQAVEAARVAFEAGISLNERKRRVRLVVDCIASSLPRIAETITREMGAPVRVAAGVQTQVPLAVANGIAQVLEHYMHEERVGNSLVVREPYGVVGAITPWNYPLYQVVAKIVPAIAAGCTVVLKPSNDAPLSTFELIDSLAQADLPPGLVNLVSGDGQRIGTRIAEHPDVDIVSFTGSTTVGTEVARAAAQTPKKVALELGGKSANVILPDGDLETAVKVGVGNAFLNGGQTCMAWTRMLIHESRYDEGIGLVSLAVSKYSVGDPTDPRTRIGPCANERQFNTVRGFVDNAVRDGFRLVAGGPDRVREPGFYLAPTVFADVDPMSELGQEEVFGPVLAVMPFRDDDEAMRIANCTPYGLSGAVWAADLDRALQFARGVRAGQLDINGGTYNPLAPFGGYKRSGIGRELGKHGLEEFLNIKSLQLPG